MASPSRVGITVPFPEVTLADHRPWFSELASLGYTDAWSSETDATDGFTPLALAAAWEPALRLGVAIAPAFTRGPALLAQTAAAMAESAPGRFCLGLGASSEVIVSKWNGITYDRPYQRVRDTLRFLRRAFTGERVDEEYETFSVRGFRLSRPLQEPPPIYLAALRPGMLRLAGRESDGVILNWLSADDVPTVVAEAGPVSEVVARIFVVCGPDVDAARAIARRMITAYVNVPVYAAFHRWLGRAPLLEKVWERWSAGDRKGAVAAVPDEVVDALVVHGPPDVCRAHVDRYVERGITLPVLSVTNAGVDLRQALRDLAPSA